MHKVYWCLFAVAMLSVIYNRPLMADGESAAFLANSGILVPVTEKHVQVLDQRVEVTLPSRAAVRRDEQVAHIRVTYTFYNDSNESANLTVAWPTDGRAFDGDRPPHTEYPVYIKLDGKPVPYNYLTYEALADQYVQPWLARIDALLADKPELKQQVTTLRSENPHIRRVLTVGDRNYHFDDATSYLGKWMQIHGYLKENDHSAAFVAGGLLGRYGNRREDAVQEALRWLDPTYSPIDVVDEISHRWSFHPILLSPEREWLIDASDYMIYPDEAFAASFGIIRFPMTLEAQTKQTLIVDYQQYFGQVGRPVEFYGLVYIMEPARRWGRWDKTTIQVHAPDGWKKVAIRPGPSRVTKSKGLTTYTTEMPHRPYENLYVSVVP